ncbi:MAG: shikimate kinase [Candidatus Moranbacteria bacterium]|nr:shikimate kinase [Candidatus Moranbacteria bacterium]
MIINKMRIYLVGFMGSGKTTVGRVLSRRLGFDFLDTDKEVEKLAGMSLRNLFKTSGETAFRELEQQVLHTTSKLEKTVISTGGGTPCFYDNMDFIKQNGVSIYLMMQPASIVNRLENSKNPRPLVHGLSSSELQAYVETELEKRKKFYSTADYVIKAESVSIDQIISFLNWK